MKKYLLLNLIVCGLTGCTNGIPRPIESNKTIKVDENKTKKTLTIDLDKKLEERDNLKGALRGTEKSKVIPIFIKDNDEIILKGTILRKSKINIIGDNDEVSFKGEEYIIKTSELKNDDLIIIKYEETKQIQLRVRRH